MASLRRKAAAFAFAGNAEALHRRTSMQSIRKTIRTEVFRPPIPADGLPTSEIAVPRA